MDYARIYMEIIKRRKQVRYDGYTESHHILPRSIGGTDDLSNIVELSAREHYICHMLLVKIYDNGSYEYYKMIHAFMMMCNVKSDLQKRDYKINSRMYEILKSEYSQIMSINQIGELNSQFGTKWIYNPQTKKTLKVPNDHKMTDGWFNGRVTDWNNHCSQKLCPICNKKGLPSKKAKYCSSVCCDESKFLCSYVYKNKEKFISNYIETKSINESLKKLGKVGAGGYYDHALKIIEKDENLYKIYLTHKK